MEAFQEKMEAAINSHQEEMKATARASQEKMEASINSIPSETEETIKDRVEDLLSSV
jgi:hypothetical protein